MGTDPTEPSTSLKLPTAPADSPLFSVRGWRRRQEGQVVWKDAGGHLGGTADEALDDVHVAPASPRKGGHVRVH
eukprot:4659699-Alexandrium_andersonii.AAC.1